MKPMRRLLLVLLLAGLAACGGPTQPGPQPAPPDSFFSAAIIDNDPAVDRETYTGGSAVASRYQGKAVITAEVSAGDDALELVLTLPSLDETEYRVGDDLTATLTYVKDRRVVYTGSALSGQLAQINDPGTFVATLSLDFETFSVGGSLGAPR